MTLISATEDKSFLSASSQLISFQQQGLASFLRHRTRRRTTALRPGTLGPSTVTRGISVVNVLLCTYMV
jgi:hypothetical protein